MNKYKQGLTRINKERQGITRKKQQKIKDRKG